MGELRVLHCACGATREAPVGVRYLSCVRCGSAMAPQTSNPFAPTPPRSIVAAATLASQLLGTLVFALAFVWIIKHGERWPVHVSILVLGAAGVFVGGSAHRGSVGALVTCAVLDLAVAIACVAKSAAVTAFVLAPVTWAAPAIAHHLAIAKLITAVIAIGAASACIAAVPQTRRFAAWRDEQILHAARAWRG